MTDKNQTDNDQYVVEESDIVDTEHVDTDAQDRNLIHSGKKRSNKKVKAFFALAVFALVAMLAAVIGMANFFKKSSVEKVPPTKAETEIYTREARSGSLDDMKKNIASTVDEMKANVKGEAEPESAPEDKKDDRTEPPVTLPAETSTTNGNGDQPPTPAQRRLLGEVLIGDDKITQSQKQPEAGQSDLPPGAARQARQQSGDFLQGADFPDGYVSKVLNRKYLLSAATSIPCVLKTKIVTSYPGVTMCQVTKDVYSDDGSTVLIRGGAQFQGEQTKVITQGVARVFVNWTTVKDGNIRVRIDALGADGLGASGVPAWIDSHFWERFGGALMLSFIDDALAAGTSQLSKQGDSQFTMNNTTGTSSELAKTTLDNTINIPPTAYVNQGEMLSVIVPRNIDFSTVYEVK
ncbi:TrbI/VirB10 family protein [Salmonella enterica]